VTLTFTRPAPDALVIVAEGTLDERNADTLVTETHRAMDAGVGRVVLDCSSLRYVSSFGLGAMVRLHKRLADRGHGLTLAAVSPRLLTELRLCAQRGVRADTERGSRARGEPERDSEASRGISASRPDWRSAPAPSQPRPTTRPCQRQGARPASQDVRAGPMAQAEGTRDRPVVESRLSPGRTPLVRSARDRQARLQDQGLRDES